MVRRWSEDSVVVALADGESAPGPHASAVKACTSRPAASDPKQSSRANAKKQPARYSLQSGPAYITLSRTTAPFYAHSDRTMFVYGRDSGSIASVQSAARSRRAVT